MSMYDRYIGGRSSSSSSKNKSMFDRYIGSSSFEEEEEKEKDTEYYNDRLRKEIDNYEKRLASVDIEKPDKRNAFEKATNLKEGQNFFFDLLELIDRPSDALRTGTKDKIEGKSFWQGAYDGFSGRADTSGSELNESAGINAALGIDKDKNKIANAIAGFGTEILYDPLNLIGGGIAKATGKGIDAATNGAKNLLNKTAEGSDFIQGATRGVDTIGEAFSTSKFDPQNTKATKEKIEAQRNALLDKNINETEWLAKTFGAENGQRIARILENDLKIEKGTKEWVDILTNLSTKGEIAVRGADRTKGLGELSKLINVMNTAARNDSKLSDKIMKQWDKQYTAQDMIKGIMTKYGNKENLLNRIKLSGVNEKEIIDFVNKFKNGNKLESALKKDGRFSKKEIETIADFHKLNKALLAGKTAKATANDLMTPIKTQRLEKAEKLDDLDLEEINDLRKLAESGDNAAKDQLLKWTKERMQSLRDGRARKGYQITKTDKTKLAVAEGVSRGLGKIIDNMGTENISIPRLQREISQNVDDQFVAGKLQQMQDDLLNWGNSLGVNIDELEGYMRHAITDEYQKATYKTNSTGKAAMGGNDATVKQRQYFGSVDDVHEAYGKEIFESNAYKAFMKGQEKVANYIAAKGFMESVLNNGSVSQKWTQELAESLGGKIPRGKTVVQPKDFDFYKVLDAKGLAHMGVQTGDKWLVDKGAANLMRNYTGLMNDDIRGVFVKSYDTMLKYWKGMSLLSAGYHARNVMGNMANRYIAGMQFPQQVKYDTLATKSITTYNKTIMPKRMKGLELSDSEKKIAKMVDDFIQTGLRDTNKIRGEIDNFGKGIDKVLGNNVKPQPTGNKVADGTFNAVKGAADGLMGANFKIGSSLDEVQRFSMYMWAKNLKQNKPNALSKTILNTPEISDPIAAVKAAMFDYQDLTKFELDVMKRLMPFYTFTRKNLPFQLKNLFLNPNKYDNINDFVQMTYEMNGSDDENIPSYLKESMALGVPGMENTLAKTYLPQSDLANYSNPNEALDQTVSMLAPHLKLPFENKLNYDFFRERKIQEFEGEQSDKYFGVSPMAAHNLDQIGLRNIQKLGQAGVNGVKELSGQEVEGSTLDKYLNSLFTDTDPTKNEQHKLYEQRQTLIDLKKWYEQQTGEKLPSIRELEKAIKSNNNNSDMFSKYIGGE